MATTAKPAAKPATGAKSGPLATAEVVDLILVAVEKDDLERVAELVERVAEEGVAGKADAKDKNVPADVIPPEEFNAMTADELVALMEHDLELYKRSLRAAAAA